MLRSSGKMDVKYLKKVGLGVLAAIVSVAFAVYLIYHISMSFKDNIVTTVASYTVETKTVRCEGYIFRDEVVLGASADGTLGLLYSDGTKVSIGSKIAEVYSSAKDLELVSRIEDIERRIDILEKSSLGGSYSDVGQASSKISGTLEEIRGYISNGDFYSVVETRDELLVQINRLQLITDSVDDFDGELANLRTELDSIRRGMGGVASTVTAPQSGYFYSSCDGGEELFSLDALENLTVSSFNTLVDSAKEISAPRGTVGKIAIGYRWYVVARTTKLESEKYDVGKSYSITFEENSDVSLSLSLERIVDDTLGDDSLLIFCCTEIPLDFDFLRCQNIGIASEEYKGYRVPRAAMRLVDGELGVYVLSGTTVSFKKIEVIYEGDSYVISALRETLREDSDKYLNLNENIIVEGKELYDGKIIVW